MTEKLNPKGIAGRKKTSYFSIPPSFMKYMLSSNMDVNLVNELASAMDEGAKKYGLRNWMDDKIHLSDYYNSSLRHYISWKNGEILDPDSGLHHLTKVISGFIVVYDALKSEFYNDDRVQSLPSKNIDLSSFETALIDWFSSDSNDISEVVSLIVDLRLSDGFVKVDNTSQVKNKTQDKVKSKINLDEEVVKKEEFSDKQMVNSEVYI